jgi:biopolymer transport protein ExbB
MTAPAAPAAAAENPYGLIPALQQGGIVTQVTFGIMVIMSVGSWYIFFVKLFEQQKIIKEGRRARTVFWQAAGPATSTEDAAAKLGVAASKLEVNGAYRQIVDDALTANSEHHKLTDSIDQHDWMVNSLARSQGAITSKLSGGMAFLATVGSTAPFVGLFGTVIGIIRALIRIGSSGQASIDAVAGPVGEALIMTAIGLVVAVPAVMQYNWLMRRNKSISEEMSRFANNLHGYLISGGSVRPTVAAPRAAATRPAAAGTAASTGGAASTSKP